MSWWQSLIWPAGYTHCSWPVLMLVEFLANQRGTLQRAWSLCVDSWRKNPQPIIIWETWNKGVTKQNSCSSLICARKGRVDLTLHALSVDMYEVSHSEPVRVSATSSSAETALTDRTGPRCLSWQRSWHRCPWFQFAILRIRTALESNLHWHWMTFPTRTLWPCFELLRDQLTQFLPPQVAK